MKNKKFRSLIDFFRTKYQKYIRLFVQVFKNISAKFQPKNCSEFFFYSHLKTVNKAIFAKIAKFDTTLLRQLLIFLKIIKKVFFLSFQDGKNLFLNAKICWKLRMLSSFENEQKWKKAFPFEVMWELNHCVINFTFAEIKRIERQKKIFFVCMKMLKTRDLAQLWKLT